MHPGQASRIPVELCLTSNIKTQTFKGYDCHHFRKLHAAGHPVVLCTGVLRVREGGRGWGVWVREVGGDALFNAVEWAERGRGKKGVV